MSWEDVCPSERSEEVNGTFTKVLRRFCTMYLVLPFSYMMGKASVLWKGLGKGKGLPRTFMKAPYYFWDLYKICTLQLVLPLEYMTRKVSATQDDLGKVRSLPRTFVKDPCPFQHLYKLTCLSETFQRFALGPSFGVY